MNLIDRDALVKTLDIVEDCEDCKYSYGPFCKKGDEFVVACEAIFDAPVIEQPEIVHCEECKYVSYEPCEGYENVYVCNRTPWSRFRGGNMPDDFCSLGERREG